MANVERLTKRVKIMEEWIEENEEVGGPEGTLDTINYLIHETRRNAQAAHDAQQAMQQFRSFAFEFLSENGMSEKWDEFVQGKENAVQKQQTEEIPLQEETESGEEADKAPKETKKDKKE